MSLPADTAKLIDSNARVLPIHGLAEAFESPVFMHPRETSALTEATRTSIGSSASSSIPTIIRERLIPNDAHPDYCHLLAMGRLRLGQLRRHRPLRIVFAFFISAGISWVFWYRKSVQELIWHLHGNIPKNVNTFKAMLPGGHFTAAYRVGCLMREAERQNQYTRTNPIYAGILAIFPPFAMIYLQSSMNSHWMLHAVHHMRTLREGRYELEANNRHKHGSLSVEE